MANFTIEKKREMANFTYFRRFKQNSELMEASASATKKQLDMADRWLGALGEDVLNIILSKLPALTFAYASCVNRTWNRVCNAILSRPKLSSSLSFNPSIPDCVEEVVSKVLAEPIRPHFAIVYVAGGLAADKIHQSMIKRFGSRTPVVTLNVPGFYGRDSITGEFKEARWDMTFDEADETEASINSRSPMPKHGIVLAVGFLPGIKAEAIPLLQLKEGASLDLAQTFAEDIWNWSDSSSGCISPSAIILFGDRHANLTSVLGALDETLSKETIIVGCQAGLVFCKSGDDSKYCSGKSRQRLDAVALVLCKDKYKPSGVGETNFHFTLSDGLASTDHYFQVVSVKCLSEQVLLLTAKVPGMHEELDGNQILNEAQIHTVDLYSPDLYIGVWKRRKCHTPTKGWSRRSGFEFHEVFSENEEYLFVRGEDIQTGERFKFFYPDVDTSVDSRIDVHSKFLDLREYADERGMEVFGGFVFSCCGRAKPPVLGVGYDASFLPELFPGIALAGVISYGEIGRFHGYDEVRGNCPYYYARPCQHVYSTVYLLFRYTPPPER